ncbi:MAG TPA: hypothetical protein VMH04_01760 [Candidatus Solibacter sp.]|nr:hypothetical protein [Candidatus Solibacter sp.]
MPDWGEVLKEIQGLTLKASQTAQGAMDLVRRQYLNKLAEDTGRNVIAYYSGFLSKPDVPSDITDEDKNGFMMCVHSIGHQRKKGLDLILHTPGGSIAATESLVDYLHQIFGNDIRAIVPQIAMSAGTMIACSCKEIILARHGNLGPIDPHLRGFPAYGVKEEFARALKEVRNDPSSIPIWQSIIGRYGPAFLSQCENAILWSKAFVEYQLEHSMFEGEASARKKAKTIVRKLTDYKGNKTHQRHIGFEELAAMGLRITRLEDLQWHQDLVLTVHHCYMHALMNTAAFKIIESHIGSAFVKQQMVQQLSIPQR